MKIDKITLKELLKYHEDIVKQNSRWRGSSNDSYAEKDARNSHGRFVEFLKSVESLVNEK